jgi:hypothetical protein
MCTFHTFTYDRLCLRPFPSFEGIRQTVQVLFHMYYTNRQTYAYHILRKGIQSTSLQPRFVGRYQQDIPALDTLIQITAESQDTAPS